MCKATYTLLSSALFNTKIPYELSAIHAFGKLIVKLKRVSLYSTEKFDVYLSPGLVPNDDPRKYFEKAKETSNKNFPRPKDLLVFSRTEQIKQQA